MYQVYGSGRTGASIGPRQETTFRRNQLKSRFSFPQSVSGTMISKILVTRKRLTSRQTSSAKPAKGVEVSKNRERFHPLHREIVSGSWNFPLWPA